MIGSVLKFLTLRVFLKHLTFFAHFFLYFLSLTVQVSGTDTRDSLMYMYTVDFLVRFGRFGNKGSQNSRVCVCYLVLSHAFVRILLVLDRQELRICDATSEPSKGGTVGVAPRT